MFIHSIQHGPSQAIYAAIKLIREARSTVLLSTFVLEGQGHAGKCLINAIVESKATSIKFLSNHHTFFSQKTLDYLALFPCMSTKLQVRVWKHRYMNANHAKFVIADGITCSLGGYNFQEAFFMKEEYAWSDLGITISNATLADNLTAYFNDLWYQSEIIDCDLNLQPNEYECPDMAKGRILNIDTEVEEENAVTLTQIPRYLFLHAQKSDSFQSIIKCLSSAQRSIDILSPNVIDSCIWDLLMFKLSSIKNFHIRILTNMGHNSSHSFLSLLKAESNFFCSKNIKFPEQLEIRYSNMKVSDVKSVHLKTDDKNWPVCIDHSKYFCVDLKHFYIGSFNMDTISMHASGETGIIIHDKPKLTAAINSFLFDILFQRATKMECSIK